MEKWAGLDYGPRMITTLATLMLVLPVQTASSTTSAAERAAVAAERAAEASLRAATALEKVAAALAGTPSTEPAPAAAAVAAAEAPVAVWTANIGANMVWFAGNSEQVAIGTDIAVERKSVDWILTGKLNGGYGWSTPPAAADGQVTALFLSTLLRADFRFNDTVSVFIAGLADMDHVKDIEYRAGGEGGASVRWFEAMVDDYVKSSLKTDLAMRAQKESRFRYYGIRENLEDTAVVAPRLGIGFVYGISKDATFTEDAEILPNLVSDDTENGTRVLINSTSKLGFKLNTSLSFNTAFVLKFDSIPAEGKEELDTQLTVGLSVTL